jgi:hypothetical protein
MSVATPRLDSRFLQRAALSDKSQKSPCAAMSEAFDVESFHADVAAQLELSDAEVRG